MGVVTIKIPTDEYRQFECGQISVIDVLKSLLALASNHTKILAELQNYHRYEDGAPVVPNFKIDSITYNAETYSGQVSLWYTVDFTFACADKRASTNHIETSNFNIDSDSLTLEIHDKLERNTIEEF